MKSASAGIRRARGARKRRKPFPITVGQTWTLDLAFIRSPFGLTFTVPAILDAGSRKVMPLRVLPRKCVFQIMGHVLLACSQFGPPEIIRTGQ